MSAYIWFANQVLTTQINTKMQFWEVRRFYWYFYYNSFALCDDMGHFFYFQNKLRHHLRHTRAIAARIFADNAQEKWRPKFPKSFILLAHNSTRLCLEFCRHMLQFEWSKTVPNLDMSRFITDQVVFRCFFYKNFTLLYPKSYICKRLTAFL